MDSAHNYVDRVATEVWFHCFTYCDNQRLRRLSLACRFFQALCEPLLFHSQTISAPSAHPGTWISTTQNLHQTAHRLAKLANSTHAASVRSWHWAGSTMLANQLVTRFPAITNIRAMQDTWLRLVGTFTTTLGAYQRLTRLHITHLTVDTEFRATLGSLKLLQDLTLHYCEVDCRTGDVLPLRAFAFLGMRGPSEQDQLHLVSTDNLQRLKIDDSSDGGCLLSALVIHPFPHLVDLTTSLSDTVADLFFRCLAACPRLESLTIIYSITTSATTIPAILPDTTIPFLKSFDGPHSLAGLFIRSSLRAISHTASSLQSLTIDPPMLPTFVPASFAAIGKLFPDLQQLTIELAETPQTLDAFDDDVEPDPAEYSDEETEYIDNRTVELWDGSMSPMSSYEEVVVRSDRSSASDDQDREPSPSPPLPPAVIVERAGHMYLGDDEHPPAFGDVLVRNPPAAVVVALESIHTLPPMLRTLHLTQSSWPHVRLRAQEHHRAVLALEGVFPLLTDVRLGERAGWLHAGWLRARGVWVREGVFYNPYRLEIGRIVSQVWNADGTRR
ncbi:hypothetical protein DFH09DRAFT_1369663 [Mycena vulgaris]|nr:hypothetical protein DFH09DRAFT_1369663 [Mycena vulgaris]